MSEAVVLNLEYAYPCGVQEQWVGGGDTQKSDFNDEFQFLGTRVTKKLRTAGLNCNLVDGRCKSMGSKRLIMNDLQ